MKKGQINTSLKKFIKKLFEFFLQGLLYLSPIGITIYLFFKVASFIDKSIQPAIEQIFKIQIPGLGLILIFLIITLTGIVGQSFFASQIQLFVNKLMKKAPVLETIYSLIQDFVSAFLGKERKFTKVVLVTVNTDTNIEKIGFLTKEDLSDLKIKDKVAVYFPFPYSMMGELLIVPVEHIKELDIHPADAMKFVISGGVSNFKQQ